MSKVQRPPVEYLDGCTMFPNKFGKVVHREICTKHDIDYWNKRTFTGKVKADWIWYKALAKKHYKQNTFMWNVVAQPMAVAGLIGLSTFGLYFWSTRHRFDKQ